MMKKLLAITLVVTSIFGFAACGTNTSATEPTATETEARNVTKDNAIADYWGVTNYGTLTEDGQVDMPVALTSQKKLQEESGVELLMVACGEDHEAQLAFKNDTVKGIWELDETATTNDRWCYTINLDDGTVWQVFILTEDNTKMYIPVENNVVIILGTSL